MDKGSTSLLNILSDAKAGIKSKPTNQEGLVVLEPARPSKNRRRRKLVGE